MAQQTGSLVQELMDLVRSQERAQEELTRTRAQLNSAWEQGQAEKTQLRARIAALEAENQKKAEALASAQQKTQALQSELNQKLQTQETALKQSLRRELTNKEEHYRQAFQAAISTQDQSFRQKAQQMMEWKEAVEKRLHDAAKEKQRLLPEMQRLKAQNQSLTQALSGAEAEIKKLQHQLQNLFAEREGFRNQYLHRLGMMEAQLKKSESELELTRSELRRLNQEAFVNRRRVQELERTLSAHPQSDPLNEISRLQAELNGPWVDSPAARQVIQDQIDELSRVRDLIRSDLNH